MSRHGHGPSGPPIRKAKDFKGSLKQLVRYLARYRVRIIIVMLFAMASTVFSIYGPKILGEATTEIFNGVMAHISGAGGGIDFARLGQILLFLLILYLVSAGFSYLQSFIMAGVSTRITYSLRGEIQTKIGRMPLSYFDRVSHGEVLSRITNDVDTLSQTLQQSITQIITSLTSFVGILYMMLTISWQLTLVALCTVPASMAFVSFIVRRSQKYFVRQQEYLGHVNGHIEELYGGHTVMKAFCGEEASIRQFDALNETLYTTAWKSQFLSTLMHPVINLVSNIGYVVVCILGGWLAAAGSLTVGGIQAFIQYVRQFNQPIAQLGNISNVLQQTAAAAERVFEFLNEPEEEPDHPRVHLEGPEESRVKIEGRVEFQHVRFGYTPEKVVIHDFSARIEPGQKVAIVGPTGAGKTTMVKLLMRFYEVGGGAIRIDGHDIRDFTRDEVRSLFGMVLQDTWLYSDTIRENIRYGRPDASDEEVAAAARAAQADHFIRTLPGAYDMVLNEEASNVSQGQKQLLTIARAILSEPKILILDEATSSVDTRTELLIQRAMDNLMRGRTSFIIAHRLSTIRDADLILCMRGGDIVEQGSHEELLRRGGFYAELYQSQFERPSQGAGEAAK
ncbi:MAG: ABC transporter ATP-binding protein [Provencibacterium sp.]|jgi:ATP-binding cassette subfamily B multidrug efflux pump|nr:ABC transporter ATP-binding protein [Provencibacterium sp.]